MKSVVLSEVTVTGRVYESKPWGCLGAVALAGTQMAPRTTGRSFRNDHVVGWLMGTGGCLPG
jgi:hypothetical protein